jgi:hypothetical protein
MCLMRIAMWSGPRNLSTAMMYSFGARSDCHVVDEPFYAAYLAKTGLDHPMRVEILASQTQDGAKVERALLAPASDKKRHFYQKHMTHHMVPGIPRDWMKKVKNVFLIRHPARVVASYAKKREGPQLADIGFRQQDELFDYARGLGQSPIVIDAADIRTDPEYMLKSLCAALDLDWDTAMSSWPAGGHSQDGVWAKHWYGAVHRSTEFADPEGELPQLDTDYASLTAQALPYYERLARWKLA